MFGRSPSERERHQEAVLRDFQDAAVQHNESQQLLSRAQRVAQESEVRYADLKRRLRRVADGAI